MPVQIKVGTFTGDGDVGPQPVTGVGFQPEWILFFSNFRDTSAIVDDVAIQFHGGGSDGTRNRSWNSFSAQNQAVSNCRRLIRDESVLSRTGFSGGEISRAIVASFDPDGFTVDWIDSDSPAVSYMCGRGGDVHVGTLTLPSSGADAVVSGLTFQPKGVYFFGNETFGGLNASQAWSRNMFGATDGVSQWACASISVNGVSTTECERRQSDRSCIIRQNRGSSTLAAEYEFGSFDPTGFTLTPITVPGADNAIFYIAFGGDYDIKCGLDLTSSNAEGTGPVDYTTGFAPLGVLQANAQVASGTPNQLVSQNIMNLAFHDGTTGFGTWVYDRDSLTTSGVFMSSQHSEFVFHHGGLSPATNAFMQPFGADKFTLNYTDVDVARRYFGWMAIGDAGDVSKDATVVNMDEEHAVTDGPRINAGIWSDTKKSPTVVFEGPRQIRPTVFGQVAQAMHHANIESSALVYVEFRIVSVSGLTNGAIGIIDEASNLDNSTFFFDKTHGIGYLPTDGSVRKAGGIVQNYTSPSTVGDVLNMAFNEGNGKIWFGINGIWNGDPAAGTGEAATANVAGRPYRVIDATANTVVARLTNFGQRPFEFPGAVPPGYGGIGDYP